MRVRENSVVGKRHYSVTSPTPHSATLQCVRKVQTVRQKQKLIGIVAIWNGFEVLSCARIESDHHIEPLASGFLDVESRHPAFDLRNSLFPRQCPMSSVRVNPANGMNTKCSGSVRRDDLAYAEISSYWRIPHEHDDGDEGLLGSGTTGKRDSGKIDTTKVSVKKNLQNPDERGTVLMVLVRTSPITRLLR